ncbi:MAG: PHP domain-containing protein [Acidobacteria bacterium]|nr:PHP domain-containing protein [Acidobacteriota bacterium]
MFMIDTHIHTCLSPCAELDMHPSALVDAAVRAGLDAIAVCDHNSVENAAAVQRAGDTAGLAVIPGMEITSAEEVHILGLLPDLTAAMELQAKVYRALPGRNDEKAFGMQVVANEFAEVLGFNEHLLSGATTLNVEKVVAAIHEVDGLAVASHVDREGFGIIGQLGFIPPGLPLDAVEVSQRMPLPAARASFAPKGEYSILCASDAHEPKDIARAATYVLMQEASLAELRRALAGEGGRAILGGGRPMEDLSLHILDIAQNSLEAGASLIEIEIMESLQEDLLTILIHDNGRGMDPKTLAKATDPFFTTRTTRRVGMGLPLLAAATRAAGGTLVIDTEPGKGTTIRATFQHRHIDRAPLGDIETTLMVLLAGQQDKDISFKHILEDRVFELDSRDFRAAEIDLASPVGLAILREAIRKGEAGLQDHI